MIESFYQQWSSMEMFSSLRSRRRVLRDNSMVEEPSATITTMNRKEKREKKIKLRNLWKVCWNFFYFQFLCVFFYPWSTPSIIVSIISALLKMRMRKTDFEFWNKYVENMPKIFKSWKGFSRSRGSQVRTEWASKSLCARERKNKI